MRHFIMVFLHSAIRVFDHLAFADRDRIGMWGHAHGGMMTYLALTRTDRIKAAVIGAGGADFERWLKLRPEIESGVAAQCIPNWTTECAKAIEARSAVRFVDRLPNYVPILLVHGTADWRIDPRGRAQPTGRHRRCAIARRELWVTRRSPRSLPSGICNDGYGFAGYSVAILAVEKWCYCLKNTDWGEGQMPGDKRAPRGERRLRVPAPWRMVAMVAWAVCGPSNAGNGLNMIGFGAESIGMGGADVAVARDTEALNTNPAGITVLKRPAFDGDSVVAFATDVAHADILGNSQRVNNWYMTAGSFGFTAPLAPGLVAGIGLFAQGGAGNVYRDVRTPFGNTDELSSQIGFAKLAPAIAWQATEELSVALSVPVAAILAKQRVFPNTSIYNPTNPEQSFFGLDLKNARGVGAGVKLGALWHPSAALSIGLTGSNRIKLTADNGNASVNMTVAGLGVVHYGNARLEGFALPPELALGAAWQFTDRTLVSADIMQLWWSNALRSTSLTLTQPDNPAAPPVLSQTAVVNARDQTVFAVGIAHELDNQVTLYGGLNYGRNPIPPENLTPLLAAIGEGHITGGFRSPLDPGWAVSGAFEYLLPKTIHYDNPTSPLGPSTERLSYVAFHLMVSRRW